MKKSTVFCAVLRYVRLFLVIFLIVAFTTTCCTMLFVSALRESLALTLTSENIGTAAKVTFVNVVLLSLLFTPAGGTIGVSMRANTDSVTVSVSDTGCGMTPETGRHIFEKFYQRDTSHAAQGNGLGLALVKRVVDILNGQIDVQSIYGQGATFTVKIRRR